KHQTIVTLEDGVKSGGFGSAILEFSATHKYKNDIHLLGIPDSFPDHGTIEELQELSGLSPKKIALFLSNL
ncbi:MAG: 1-deoxy-D-xylulose-5-phosphate synthase, partial [Flavobacteriaceae bacterium]|nr:1-deoxy-D-xylulose-5-phosphate synthase [Flavobacteriaceae bacterium]